MEINFRQFMRMQRLWFRIRARGQVITPDFVMTNAPVFRAAMESRYTIRG